jgi:hypothetical protein
MLIEQRIRETGEKLTFAGQDGVAFVEERLGDSESVIKMSEEDEKEHAEFSAREMERLIREANERAENGK